MHEQYAHTHYSVNQNMRGRIGSALFDGLRGSMANHLGPNVARLRDSMGLNQTMFGELVKASQATVARWEQGSQPKPEALVMLAGLASATVADFVSKPWTPREAASQGGMHVFDYDRAFGALMMPVKLPSEASLTEMFSALLEVLEGETDLDVRARRLAQLLPSALEQCVYRSLSARPDQLAAPAPASDAPDPAKASPEQPPTPRI